MNTKSPPTPFFLKGGVPGLGGHRGTPIDPEKKYFSGFRDSSAVMGAGPKPPVAEGGPSAWPMEGPTGLVPGVGGRGSAPSPCPPNESRKTEKDL